MQEAAVPIRGTAATRPGDFGEEVPTAEQLVNKKPKVDPSLLRKDKVPLVDYYKAWDQVDVDEELREADGTAQPVMNNVMKAAFDENRGAVKPKNVGFKVSGGSRHGPSVWEELKNEGNELFRQRSYLQAIEKYSECLVPRD